MKDSLLLDIEYTSIEELAKYIGVLIKHKLKNKGEFENIKEILVTVREYQGLECEICEIYNPRLWWW